MKQTRLTWRFRFSKNIGEHIIQILNITQTRTAWSGEAASNPAQRRRCNGDYAIRQDALALDMPAKFVYLEIVITYLYN